MIYKNIYLLKMPCIRILCIFFALKEGYYFYPTVNAYNIFCEALLLM